MNDIAAQLQHGTIELRSVAAEKLFSYAAEHEPARAFVAEPAVVQSLVNVLSCNVLCICLMKSACSILCGTPSCLWQQALNLSSCRVLEDGNSMQRMQGPCTYSATQGCGDGCSIIAVLSAWLLHWFRQARPRPDMQVRLLYDGRERGRMYAAYALSSVMTPEADLESICCAGVVPALIAVLNSSRVSHWPFPT